MDPKAKTATIASFVIKVDGQAIDAKLQNSIVELVVDSNLHLPDMCALQLTLTDSTPIDSETFGLGKSLQVDVPPPGGGTAVLLFKGEIAAIEPEFTEAHEIRLTVRGYAKSHRLHRGKKTRVFANMTDSDIVAKIAQEAGLSASTDATSVTHEHAWQNNINDAEFVRSLAERLGYQFYVDDTTLYFKKYAPSGTPVDLEWGSNLRSFRPRIAATHQADKSTVTSWDPAQKQLVKGEATSPTSTSNQGGVTEGGGAKAKSAFGGSADAAVVDYPALVASQATGLAQAQLDEISAEFVQAEGVCLGNPGVKAGKLVKISLVGTRFSGNYLITRATHTVTTAGEYEVHFGIHGRRPDTLTDMLRGQDRADDGRGLWTGVVPAIVTNNADPDGLGRVKLKYPWLSDSLESHWARVSAPGGGATRGLYFIPEVNDEVLVAFEHGDFNQPYVLGGLWHKKDLPPKKSDQVVADGKVNERIIQSRSGHVIILGDKQGEEQIIIRDKTTKNEIIISSKDNTLTINIEADVTLTAKGKVTSTSTGETAVTSKGNVSIKADAGTNVTVEGTHITIKGQGNISVQATGNLELKANGQLNIQGTQVSIQGQAMTEVKSSGILQMQGAMVKIN